MSPHSETPFDNIESSHEYVSMLADAVGVALNEVQSDIASASADGADRRLEALQLVAFKLAKLEGHVSSSKRILNDLRLLRRLLLDERALTKVARQGGD